VVIVFGVAYYSSKWCHLYQNCHRIRKVFYDACARFGWGSSISVLTIRSPRGISAPSYSPQTDRKEQALGYLHFIFPDQGPTGGGLGVQPPPPKFRRPSKIVPNSTRFENLKITEFRTPTPQDVGKKGSKILKLPPVRNCFTLARTNKSVVIINRFKVPKIKKILLYEVKFLATNYSCIQNP